jgi:hypothetical protein
MTKAKLDEAKVQPASGKRRPIGLARGEFTVPKEFFDPLPDEIINGFYGDCEEDPK